PSVIEQWITRLAVERIEVKVRKFEERLKELIDAQHPVIKDPPSRYGEIPFGLNPEELPAPSASFAQRDLARQELWEQMLYEGVMEALGYSKNEIPFLRLAKNL